MPNWLLRPDFEFGGGREPGAATIAALQELVSSMAGERVVSPMQRFRRMSQQVQAEQEDDDDDDDDNEDFYTSYWASALGHPPAGDNWYPKITEPQPAGVKLLRSGDFGRARNRLGTPRNSNIYSRLRRVALQPRTANAVDLKHNLIPNTHGTTVAAYYSNIYVAQFSPGASHGTSVLL